MSLSFQPVSSSLDLSAIVDSLNTYPHYLGKSDATDPSVTGSASGPFSSVLYTDKAADGDDANDKAMFSAVVLVLQENEWLNPEGSWGKSDNNNKQADQSSQHAVKDSCLRFSCAAVPHNAPPELRPMKAHFSNYLSNLETLYKRSMNFFKYTNPKYTGLVSADKQSFSVTHKLLPVTNLLDHCLLTEC